jgi:hypothetical protein
MPRGKHLPPATRRAIKRRLKAGDLPQIVAKEYGITRKTCQHYLAAMRAEIRLKMQLRGCSNQAIEEEIHRVFRHDRCQFLTVECPGEIAAKYILEGGGNRDGRPKSYP